MYEVALQFLKGWYGVVQIWRCHLQLNREPDDVHSLLNCFRWFLEHIFNPSSVIDPAITCVVVFSLFSIFEYYKVAPKSKPFSPRQGVQALFYPF